MTDRRLLRSNGRVAHVSLRGQVEAERFVAGERSRVVAASSPVLGQPGGERERELWFGEEFLVLDRDEGLAFGFCARDGYVGWVRGDALGEPVDTTHRVAVSRTYAKMTPRARGTETMLPLTFGAAVAVVESSGDWSCVDAGKDSPCWVPTRHLASDAPHRDPVAVARLFLGTPYLWGGNSAYGIDCSGLVQAVRHACGLACPGDSDMQEAMPGEQLSEGAALEPGDLIFWKGHVAMATGPKTMIHANGHHMMVVEEPIAPAIVRIAAKDAGPVTSRLRPDRVPFQPVV